MLWWKTQGAVYRYIIISNIICHSSGHSHSSKVVRWAKRISLFHSYLTDFTNFRNSSAKLFTISILIIVNIIIIHITSIGSNINIIGLHLLHCFSSTWVCSHPPGTDMDSFSRRYDKYLKDLLLGHFLKLNPSISFSWKVNIQIRTQIL